MERKTNYSNRRALICIEHLAELGYKSYWTAETPKGSPNISRTITLFNNGTGKSALLLEYGDGEGWDIYGRLCASNKVSDTLTALSNFSQTESPIIAVLTAALQGLQTAKQSLETPNDETCRGLALMSLTDHIAKLSEAITLERSR